MGASLPSTKRISVETQSSVPSGLRNLGNTCYMNSALQCLFQAKEFNAILAKSDQSRMLESYFALIQQQKRLRCLIRIKGELKKADRRFAGFKQQDASEFLTLFFSRLFNATPGLEEDVQRLFSATTELTSSCRECSHAVISSSQQYPLSLPLTPARVRIRMHPGDPADTEFDIEGSELMHSDFILSEAKRITGKEHLWIVTQSELELVRVIIDGNENLKKMEVSDKLLFYYEVTDSECLAEIKIYHGTFRKQLQRCIVKKLPRSFDIIELKSRLTEELQKELEVEVQGFFAESSDTFCVPFGRQKVDLALADFTAILQSAFPVLRIQCVVGNVLTKNAKKISVEVPRTEESLLLDDILTSFQAEEPLTEIISCETCQKQTEHTKKSRLARLSQYLIVALQRYSSLDGSKDMRFVQFKLEQQFNVDGVAKTYNLFAVVQHHGRMFTSGHYTSCVRHQQDWFLCNDSSITRIPPEDVEAQVQIDAYLLFYEKATEF